MKLSDPSILHVKVWSSSIWRNLYTNKKIKIQSFRNIYTSIFSTIHIPLHACVLFIIYKYRYLIVFTFQSFFIAYLILPSYWLSFFKFHWTIIDDETRISVIIINQISFILLASFFMIFLFCLNKTKTVLLHLFFPFFVIFYQSVDSCICIKYNGFNSST